MYRKSVSAILPCVIITALALAGTVLTAHASPGDATTPAGAGVGSVVVFGPAVGAAPGLATPPGFVLGPAVGTPPSITAPRGLILLPTVGTAPAIAAPRSLILVPTPATGSLVLPVQTVPPSGSGPAITRYTLVIPGPNPSQNTGVALQLQLSITIGANGQVTVYPVPAP
jgi:hypothetical protein